MKKSVYEACAIVEDFAGYPVNPEMQLKAWAYLIETGEGWSFQGFYGRTMQRLIDLGLVTSKGVINKAKAAVLGYNIKNL